MAKNKKYKKYKVKGFIINFNDYHEDTICERCGKKALYAKFKTRKEYIKECLTPWENEYLFVCFEHRYLLGEN